MRLILRPGTQILINMKIWKIILIIIVVGGIAGAVIGYSMWNKPHKNYEDADVDYELTANAMYDEFEAEEAASREKYVGKVVAVNGTIEEMTESGDGTTNVIFSAENAMMGGINARLSSKYNEGAELNGKLASLSEGEAVTLKCRCVGYEKDLITEVKLDNCYIVE